jgi:hypothetical protein
MLRFRGRAVFRGMDRWFFWGGRKTSMFQLLFVSVCMFVCVCVCVCVCV